MKSIILDYIIRRKSHENGIFSILNLFRVVQNLARIYASIKWVMRKLCKESERLTPFLKLTSKCKKIPPTPRLNDCPFTPLQTPMPTFDPLPPHLSHPQHDHLRHPPTWTNSLHLNYHPLEQPPPTPYPPEPSPHLNHILKETSFSYWVTFKK